MSTLNLSEPDEPQLVYQRIGAGSFGTVYAESGTRVAYKQVQREDDGDTLGAEYLALDRLYGLCNSDSFFTVPRAIAFYNPIGDIFLVRQPSTSSTRRRSPQAAIRRRELVQFNTATYAMERISHLPRGLASTVAAAFYPEQQRTQLGPRLCRLYFGKILDGPRPSRFFNSNNFPLDVARYTTLQETETLASVNDVAYGMGEMLGRIHWRGVDS